MNIKSFVEKLTGIDKIKAKASAEAADALRLAREAEEIAKEASRLAKEADEARKKAEQEERLAKMSPKDRATINKEPWVAVLETKVNKDNVRNGFFELDWNEYFVNQLKEAGYQGKTGEEIVDQWFQELCRNVGSEADINMDRRGSGFVNRALRDDGLTEVS